MKLIEVAKKLNSLGITLGEIRFDNGLFGINMNTQAKSEMVLYEDGKVKTRYFDDWVDMNNGVDEIVQDLCILFKKCICGRDYFSRECANLCVKLGLMSVSSKTVNAYSV